jgi:putative acetyltransferase
VKPGEEETISFLSDNVHNMNFIVREMRDEDARSFLEVLHAAVRAIAARDYATEVIEAWAPLPITQTRVDAVVANQENEVRFVAEREGKLIGIACLVIENHELRACYVAPEVARMGVGKSLIFRIEQAARSAGLEYLQAVSSLTAESFYRGLGYEVIEYGEHLLRSRTLSVIRVFETVGCAI